MSRAMPISTPTTPSHDGRTAVDDDRGRHQQRPQPGEQVPEVLADADPEQPVERGEHDLDGLARGVTLRAVGRRDVASRQLRDRERPAHQTQALDDRRGRPDDDRQDGQRRRRRQDDGEQRRQRQHQERADQQRLPAQDQPGAAGDEPPQDLVGLLSQDVRVVERATELEERDVEGDRHRDQQDRR